MTPHWVQSAFATTKRRWTLKVFLQKYLALALAGFLAGWMTQGYVKLPLEVPHHESIINYSPKPVWCRLRVLIFTGDYFYTFFFFWFSVGVRNQAPLPQGVYRAIWNSCDFLWNIISYLFLWFDFMPFLAPENSFFLKNKTWLCGKYFCYVAPSISMWKGPIWVSSVGWVVRSGLGNFLCILLELLYNEV